MKNSKVLFTAHEEADGVELLADGLIRVNTDNPDYGSIMVTSVARTITNGFLNKRKRVAFINGTIEDLEDFISEYNVTVGSDYSKKVAPAKLLVKEQHEPFYEDQLPKVYPEGHDYEGETILSNGEEVYRMTSISHDLAEPDVLLPTDSIETEDNGAAENVSEETKVADETA